MNSKITFSLIILISLFFNSFSQTEEKPGQKLTAAYYNKAKGFYEAKNYPDAIVNFEKAAQSALDEGEKTIADTSYIYLSAIYTNLGNTDLKNQALDEAIENYYKALTYKSNNYKAYFGLGQIYMQKGNLASMKDAFDKTIAMAGNDTKTIGNARDAATSAYQRAGALALQAKKYNEAVSYLFSSQEYNNKEPRTYYYLAIAYNGLLKSDNAIIAAKKALELQTGDKSDIYFELGRAYEMEGDKSSACKNYGKVVKGDHIGEAKYKLEQVLKCQ